MQEQKQLTEQYLHILQQLNKELDRKEFCKIHGISESKLSRIMSGAIMPTLELLDYITQHAGYKIKLTLE